MQSLQAQQQGLQQQQRANREQRIEAARKLQGLRGKVLQREQQMQQLEEEMFRLKKKDIVCEYLRKFSFSFFLLIFYCFLGGRNS